jgi:hypothetical protein
MLYRKYLAFYRCTFPCIWIVVSAWFIDRLLMELGHRSHITEICTHSDLQYVYVHKWLTITAGTIQSYYSVKERTTQFERERNLMGIEDRICNIHIQLLQILLCVCWLTVISTIIDVSPWLCIENASRYRACYCVLGFLGMVVIIPLESYLWDKTLRKAILETTSPFHI